MKRLITAIAILGTLATAYGMERGGKRETKESDQFVKNKDVKLAGYREKLSILKESASCVEWAQSYDAVTACETRERAAMEEHSRQMKQRWEGLKKP